MSVATTPHRSAAGALTVVMLTCSAYAVAGGAPDQRLVDAAKSQDRASVVALVEGGADVSATHPDGSTALHWAAYWDDQAMVDLLLSAGAPVDAVNDFGATPLWLACAEGRSEMIQRLLEAGANPNLALRLGETPLMAAARTGSVRSVELLLTHGADPDATEQSRGQNALMWATAQGHHEAMRALIAGGANVSARSGVRSMLVNAGEDGLTRKSGDYTAFIEEGQGGFTPLLFAARRNDVVAAEILLDAGAGVDERTPMGATPLVLAAHSAQWDVAQYLLSRGADPNVDDAGYTALHAAVLRHHRPTVRLLLTHGANPDARISQATPYRRFSHDYAFDPSWAGGTAFWLASKIGSTDLMRDLAAAGADPLAVSADGSTALVAAATGARRVRHGTKTADEQVLEAVRLALELGIDIDAANDFGETALHVVAARRLNTAVEFLAKQGAQLELPNQYGLTPLALAKQDFSHLTVVQFAALRHRPTRRDTTTAELLRSLGATE